MRNLCVPTSEKPGGGANGDDQILHPRPGFSTDASTKDSSQDFVADFFTMTMNGKLSFCLIY